MDIVFKALADGSRRHLLDKLRRQDGLTLTQLCDELNMSRQAVSKHLIMLENANLVISVQKGRLKHHYLNAVPIQQIIDRWVGQFRQVQTSALTQLKNDLEKTR